MVVGSPSRGRVLCVTSNFPRWWGDSTTPFVLHLAQHLVELGWEIHVLAPHFEGAARRERLGGVEIERFRYAWPESAQTVCYQGGAMINLRNRPQERVKLPALVMAEWLTVERRLRRDDYDLVHSHWVLPQGFVGMLATRGSRVPHVITLHGGDVFSLTGPLMTRFKRAALYRAAGVTVNSSVTEAAVREMAPDCRTIHRIPMGVDDDHQAEQELLLAQELRREHLRGEGPLLVFVGRLVDEKGAEDAVRAMAMLQGLMDAHLLVLGEGPERPKLEELVARLGVAESVTFLGWVQPDEVRAYLAASDIFVGPSRRAADGWIEGQGLTFLEAMAAGTAVVATRSGGIVDSVRHEHSGLLVDERSPRQIGDAIQRLTADEDLRQRLIQGGHEVVSSGFSKRCCVGRFDQLFQDILASRRLLSLNGDTRPRARR